MAQRFFLNYSLIHDCRPNIDGISGEELNTIRMQYPFLEYFTIKEFLKNVNPLEKLEILSKNNWPPAPGYCPKILGELHKNPNIINDIDFHKNVSSVYNKDYWDMRIEFWEDVNFFPSRNSYIKYSIDAHLKNDYIATIYVIVPQFEGIIRDYLSVCGKRSDMKFSDCLDELMSVLISRKITIFPMMVIKIIFEYLKTGTFWKNTRDIQDPTKSINRHGIAHGKFTAVECEELSLKYLILLDALSLILLQDKVLTRTI